MTISQRCALILCLIAGAARTGWAGDCSKISVTGSATKQVAPDVAYITLFVNGDGVLMSDAAKKADDQVEIVLKAIRDVQTNLLDVAITTLEVGEKSARSWSSDQQSNPPRPQVARQLRIAIQPDATLAYAIIDAAIRSGAVLTRDSMTRYSGSVSGTVVYGAKEDDLLDAEMKKAALEDAKKQAETTAQWAGKSVGPLCSIGCQSTTTWPQRTSFGDKSADYPTKYLSMDPKQIEIKATVSATFELQDP